MLEDGTPTQIVLGDCVFSDENPSLILTTHYERFIWRSAPNHLSVICFRGISLIHSKGEPTTSYEVLMIKESERGIESDRLFGSGLQNP